MGKYIITDQNQKRASEMISKCYENDRVTIVYNKHGVVISRYDSGSKICFSSNCHWSDDMVTIYKVDPNSKLVGQEHDDLSYSYGGTVKSNILTLTFAMRKMFKFAEKEILERGMY